MAASRKCGDAGGGAERLEAAGDGRNGTAGGTRVSEGRFTRPTPGGPVAVRFPQIARRRLDTGLDVWVIEDAAVPLVTMSLLVARGTGDDPADRHGLASLAGDMLDEGAGARDAIQLAE